MEWDISGGLVGKTVLLHPLQGGFFAGGRDLALARLLPRE